MALIASVAVDAATFTIDKLYDYAVPADLEAGTKPGVRVKAPFSKGNRQVEGFVFAVHEGDAKGLKELRSVEDGEPLVSKDFLELAKWMKSRFFCTLYEAVRAMLPSGVWRLSGDRTTELARLAAAPEDALAQAEKRAKKAPQQAELLRLLAQLGEASSKELTYFTGASRQSLKGLERQGLIELIKIPAYRRPAYSESASRSMEELTEEQTRAFEGIAALMDGTARAALLRGVTGSGKTAVYIRLIARAIERGGRAIALVPEIALTPQLVATFRLHFGDAVAVLHSSLTQAERLDEWRRIRDGLVNVVVGTRSAVFAPVEGLKLLIIDEEQELTYKSEMTPRYHARDVAKFLCARSGALLLLGSATPSVETNYLAETGRYPLFRLEKRYNEMTLPEVVIVDMRAELKAGNGGSVSGRLREELEKNIERGEQSILFINRRGTNNLVSCPECGFMHSCPNCSARLVYHGANGRLMCHYCGYSRPAERTCPECGGRMKFFGTGTQKVEDELEELFPGVPMLRMDADSVSAANSHDEILSEFSKKKIPILIGTQMVTKGLNFDDVTLVGVLSADQMLYSGDWRAQERTFSLVTQAVGRSGRAKKAGRAVIQTFTPENDVIRCAAAQDYDAFYRSEIKLRELSGTPPFSEQYAVFASGEDEEAVIACCREIKAAFLSSLGENSGARVLGPVPAAVVRVQGRYRYRVYVDTAPDPAVRGLIAGAIRKYSKDRRFRGVALFGDVDPID
ncbi:MAG: primosomal protein N' [Oscillospiraceae bacterium]|nr:primosomal protein N' [Oscillospiraceae bacterium]